MKDVFYLLLGAAIGAIIALRLAPSRGHERRTALPATAHKDLHKLRSEWHTTMAKTHERLDQIQADLNQALSRTQSEGGDAG